MQRTIKYKVREVPELKKKDGKRKYKKIKLKPKRGQRKNRFQNMPQLALLQIYREQIRELSDKLKTQQMSQNDKISKKIDQTREKLQQALQSGDRVKEERMREKLDMLQKQQNQNIQNMLLIDQQKINEIQPLSGFQDSTIIYDSLRRTKQQQQDYTDNQINLQHKSLEQIKKIKNSLMLKKKALQEDLDQTMDRDKKQRNKQRIRELQGEIAKIQYDIKEQKKQKDESQQILKILQDDQKSQKMKIKQPSNKNIEMMISPISKLQTIQSPIQSLEFANISEQEDEQDEQEEQKGNGSRKMFTFNIRDLVDGYHKDDFQEMLTLFFPQYTVQMLMDGEMAKAISPTIVVMLKDGHYTGWVYDDNQEIAYFDSLGTRQERLNDDMKQILDFSQNISKNLGVKFKYNTNDLQSNYYTQNMCAFLLFQFLFNYITSDQDYEDATEFDQSKDEPGQFLFL